MRKKLPTVNVEFACGHVGTQVYLDYADYLKLEWNPFAVRLAVWTKIARLLDFVCRVTEFPYMPPATPKRAWLVLRIFLLQMLLVAYRRVTKLRDLLDKFIDDRFEIVHDPLRRRPWDQAVIVPFLRREAE